MRIDLPDKIRQISNILFIITQILGSYITNILGAGLSIAQSSKIFPFPLLPISFVFIIWSVLFPATIAYGIFQLLSFNTGNNLLREIGGKTAISFFLITVWIVVTQLFDIAKLDFIFSIPIVFFLLSSVLDMRKFYFAMSQQEYYCVYAPISALGGWLTIAAVLTISCAIKYRIANNFGMSDTAISSILLMIASVFVIYFFFISKHNAFFITPVIWGMIGIWLASSQTYSNVVIGTCALFCAIIFILLLIYSPRKFRQRYIFKR